MTQNSIADNRMVWLDVVRCVAMLMVIGVHCIDPFYISPTMRVIPGCWVCPKKSSATSSAILRDMSRKASSIL